MRPHANRVSTVVPSPIGPLRLVARVAPSGSREEAPLAGLYTDAQAVDPRVVAAELREGPAPFGTAVQQLAEYFEGTRRAFELPLDLAQGTAFQRDVWRALQAIPCGETVTYGEVARRVGRPSSVRAVGAAVGQNPWGIIVPCHRVVGSSGALTGFAGGLPRKRWLLEHEGVRVRGGESDADPRAKVSASVGAQRTLAL